jgi:hypothetical protein|tara:strand:- start:297 stop:617 length:321 start_codon:yes stop_codon:yes gene_type:complete
MAYKMKASIPSLCSSPLQINEPKKRGRLHIENIDGIKNKNTAEQSSDNSNLRVNENYDTNDSFVNTKINDPKGVLNREARKREYNKGYRYKSEKDGSITLKGRKGN